VKACQRCWGNAQCAGKRHVAGRAKRTGCAACWPGRTRQCGAQVMLAAGTHQQCCQPRGWQRQVHAPVHGPTQQRGGPCRASNAAGQSVRGPSVRPPTSLCRAAAATKVDDLKHGFECRGQGLGAVLTWAEVLVCHSHHAGNAAPQRQRPTLGQVAQRLLRQQEGRQERRRNGGGGQSRGTQKGSSHCGPQVLSARQAGLTPGGAACPPPPARTRAPPRPAAQTPAPPGWSRGHHPCCPGRPAAPAWRCRRRPPGWACGWGRFPGHARSLQLCCCKQCRPGRAAARPPGAAAAGVPQLRHQRVQGHHAGGA